jgi:hypothetical protein
MDQRNLSSLPVELLQQIFDNLPITDCESITNAHSDTTRKSDFEGVYEDRSSLHRYFTNSGLDGKQMMKILSSCHVFLIGSRSLEFFVPGSIQQHSDWNFLMDYSPTSTHEFMSSMETMGVVWDDLADRIYKRVVENTDDICVMPHQIEDIVTKLHSRYNGLHDEIDVKISAIVHELTVTAMNTGPDGWIVVLYDDNQHICSHPIDKNQQQYYPDTANGASGMIKIDNVETEVTLSFNPTYRGGRLQMPNILHKFPLSILQCMITGFGALHLYGKEACERVSYRWEPPFSTAYMERDSRCEEMLISYLKRGFTIKYHPWNGDHLGVSRSSNENESIRILSPVQSGWNKTLWAEVQQAYFDLKWRELTMHTESNEYSYTGILSEALEEVMCYSTGIAVPKAHKEYLNYHGIIDV